MTTNSKQLAVVTGGTKGIGKATIEKFLNSDIDVITCARTEEDLESMKADYQDKFESKIYVSRADMSKKDEIVEFVDFIKLIGRPIDILVNNAGVFFTRVGA